MGFCHFKLGEHRQAIAHFQKVIDLDPSSAIDYANIGVVDGGRHDPVCAGGTQRIDDRQLA